MHLVCSWLVTTCALFRYGVGLSVVSMVLKCTKHFNIHTLHDHSPHIRQRASGQSPQKDGNHFYLRQQRCMDVKLIIHGSDDCRNIMRTGKELLTTKQTVEHSILRSESFVWRAWRKLCFSAWCPWSRPCNRQWKIRAKVPRLKCRCNFRACKFILKPSGNSVIEANVQSGEIDQSISWHWSCIEKLKL